jgi:hypothetical protein
MLGLPIEVGVVAVLFSHISGLGLEGVEVQVKWKRSLGLAGEIFVPQGFCCGDRMLRGVEACVDLIGDDAGG